MRQVFKDFRLERIFRRDGFIWLRENYNVDIEALRSAYQDLEPPYDQGFHTTMFATDALTRQRVHQTICDQLVPVMNDVLQDYEPIIANFIVKEPVEDSYLNIHQDWSFVEEPEFESINFWMPLQDVTESNGALRFLRGSHASNNYYRAPNIPFPFVEQEAEIDNKMESLVMRAGEIVVFSNRIIHSSHLNLSDEPRLAITFNAKPKETRSVQYFMPDQNNPLEIEVYEVDTPYYFDYKVCEKPRNAKFIEKKTIPEPELRIGGEINLPEQVAEYYNKKLESYENAYGNIIQALRPSDDEELMAYISNNIGFQPGEKVLDAGCGVAGPAAYFAKHHDVHVTGLNYSDDQLKKGNESIISLGLQNKVYLIKGDYHKLPEYFDEGQFDKAIFLESLGHSSDIETAIKGAYNILKPGGEIYVKDFFFKETYREDFRNYINTLTANINEYYYYNTLDFTKFVYYLRKANFEIQFIKPIDFENDVEVASKFETENEIDLFEGRRSFPYADWLEIKCKKPMYEFNEWG